MFASNVLLTNRIFQQILPVNLTHNKKKIFNDPIYGFITIPSEFIHDLIEHPYFQRLRRIRQLGLTDYVYPGAHHSRFHHALGAMHLMQMAIETLRSKGHVISPEEEEGANAAILLHDMGHGPFSHALEYSIIKGVEHEKLSLLFMEHLNQHFAQKLDLAIRIFTDSYPKRFLHQLVSSQLDADRLDYLNRDSFYSGVTEGTVGSDRIIRMLDVIDDSLVVQEKGIYSVEKFLLARRLMYWQVYLHKTVLAAESLLVNMLRRAKFLAMKGEKVFSTSALSVFISTDIGANDLKNDPALLARFAQLDDYDIISSAKEWMMHPDPVLADLADRLINRRLFRIRISDKPFDEKQIFLLKQQLLTNGLNEDETNYYIFTGEISNYAYKVGDEKILIALKNGEIKDIREASEQLRIPVLSESIRKYFLCCPKELDQVKIF